MSKDDRYIHIHVYMYVMTGAGMVSRTIPR
jgi:hypothetical protein